MPGSASLRRHAQAGADHRGGVLEPWKAPLLRAGRFAQGAAGGRAVRRIDAIFAIEREINGRSAVERAAARQERTVPLVAELATWMRAERARLSHHAGTAKAIDYILKRWPAFTRFLDDGRIGLSNNAAERALRGIALGRRAWLFAGSDRGGERAAAMYTLIATAKLRRARPHRRSPGLAASRASPLALEDAPPSSRRRLIGIRRGRRRMVTQELPEAPCLFEADRRPATERAGFSRDGWLRG